MSETQSYTGGCHCGAVRYSVKLSLARVISCNCSICSKSGILLSFAPATEFELHSGQDQLSDYQFNRNIIHHLFCQRCGVRSFVRGTGRDGQQMVGVNVRCLDDVDLTTLNLIPVDGRSS